MCENLREVLLNGHCVGERHLFHYFSPGMRRCDVVFEAIATNWLKWLQRAGGWPRSSRPSPRARPTFSLSGLGHTSCLAATSLSPNLHPPLSLSPPFFGTVSAAEPARIPWPQFQFQRDFQLGNMKDRMLTTECNIAIKMACIFLKRTITKILVTMCTMELKILSTNIKRTPISPQTTPIQKKSAGII